MPQGLRIDRSSTPGTTRAEDDFELVEMVNLPTSDTGIGGTISTSQGIHGPRVKWYPGRPGRMEPCLTVTVEDTPAVVNNGLPSRIAVGAARDVVAWVTLNRSALLGFWVGGISWTRQDVAAFVDGLHKL